MGPSQHPLDGAARELARRLRAREVPTQGTRAQLRDHFGVSRLTQSNERAITEALERAGLEAEPPLTAGGSQHDRVVLRARGAPSAPGAPTKSANTEWSDLSTGEKGCAVGCLLIVALLLLAGCGAVLGVDDDPQQSARETQTDTTSTDATPPRSTETQPAPPAEIAQGRRDADRGDWAAVAVALASLDGDDDRSLRRYARRRVVRVARAFVRGGELRNARSELVEADRQFGLSGESERELTNVRAALAQKRRDQQAAREAAPQPTVPDDPAPDETDGPTPDEGSAPEPDGGSSGGYTGSCDTSPPDIPVTPGSPGDRDGDGVACES